MKNAIPMRCPVCVHKPAGYYGRLVFPEEMTADALFTQPPVCPNHPAGYEHALVPVPARTTKIAAPVG